MKVSGVAKKTLYHHFKSKEELIQATLIYRDKQFSTWLCSYLKNTQAPKDKLLAIFDALHLWFNDQVEDFLKFNGCFFVKTSGEFSLAGSPINNMCSAHKSAIEEKDIRHCQAAIFRCKQSKVYH